MDRVTGSLAVTMMGIILMNNRIERLSFNIRKVNLLVQFFVYLSNDSTVEC